MLVEDEVFLLPAVIVNSGRSFLCEKYLYRYPKLLESSGDLDRWNLLGVASRLSVERNVGV